MEAYTYKIKEIIDRMVKSNPFWERFITVEGDVKKTSKGYKVVFEDGSSLPIKTNDDIVLTKGHHKLSGFLNYSGQNGFGSDKPNRTDSICIKKGMVAFEFKVISNDKKDKYSMISRKRHRRDIFAALQRIWTERKKAKVVIITSSASVANDDIHAGLYMNDILKIEEFYDIDTEVISFEDKKMNEKDLVNKLLDKLNDTDAKADIVIVSRGGKDSQSDYGILEKEEVKLNIANMTALTICAVGHVKDEKSDNSFHQYFDFDAQTPSLAGVRLREWLLAFKTIPNNIQLFQD